MATVVAFTATEYLPASQLSQAVAPDSVLYFPGGHDEQFAVNADAAPVCPYVPAEQIVPEHEVAPALPEYLPASQLVQVVEPVIEI